MNTINTWQGWLECFERLVSVDSLAALARMNAGAEDAPREWASLFHIGNLFNQANAMLLACLQEPAPAAEQALAKIAAVARKVNFGKPPRSLKKREREAYAAAARQFQPYYAAEADALYALFMHYLRDTYDAAGDANLLMQEGSFEMARGRPARALQLVGEAGALVLRGRPLWAGWTREGEADFPYWARVLLTVLHDWRANGVLPLGPAPAERARAAALAESLARLYAPQPPDATDLAEPAAEPEPASDTDLAFVAQWVELAGRDKPLEPGEIQGLGELYERYTAMSVQLLEALTLDEVEMPPEQLVDLAAASIGVLRCTDAHAIDLLINIVRDDEERYELGMIEEALWSLQQLGAAALPAVFDFVRYSGIVSAREDMLEALGVVGRGVPEVFDYLAAKFLGLSWRDGKLAYVLPLALLGDARAVPMLCDALSDPAVDEDAVWELLDGLEEMGVAFSVDTSNGNVTLPDYGVIEAVAPEDWSPRAEREELELQELDQLEGSNPTWQSDPDDAVVFDAFGIAHCVDCGQVMHRAHGGWEHPIDMDEFAPPQKPIRVDQTARNDLCPCGSGKKFKYCHGRPDLLRVN